MFSSYVIIYIIKYCIPCLIALQLCSHICCHILFSIISLYMIKKYWYICHNSRAKRNVYIHLALHTGEKPYFTTIFHKCGKALAMPNASINLMIIPANKNVRLGYVHILCYRYFHQYNQCSKFKAPISHGKIHTDEKLYQCINNGTASPFSCTICDWGIMECDLLGIYSASIKSMKWR